MNRRRPLVLVSVVVVLCITGAVIAGVASGSGFSPVAFSVYGSKVSQADFNDELREIADHPAAMRAVLGVPVASTTGSITAQATTSWLGIRIPIELLRHGASVRHLSIGAAQRGAADQALGQTLQQVNLQASDLPAVTHALLVDYFAYRIALKLTGQSAYQAFINRAARQGNVTVDPRYAQFGPQGLCPPFGCAAASGNAGG
ncbi:MAG: hypothetical protein ACHQ52_11150 [Candidatus Eisenbacteria bacterium]